MGTPHSGQIRVVGPISWPFGQWRTAGAAVDPSAATVDSPGSGGVDSPSVTGGPELSTPLTVDNIAGHVAGRRREVRGTTMVTRSSPDGPLGAPERGSPWRRRGGTRAAGAPRARVWMVVSAGALCLAVVWTWGIAEPPSARAGSLALSQPHVVPAPNGGALDATNCPDAEDCVSVGQSNVGQLIVETTHWSNSVAVSSGTRFMGAGRIRGALSAVHCALRGLCVAVGSTTGGHGLVAVGRRVRRGWMWVARAETSGAAVAWGEGGGFSGVACPGTLVCWAVGQDARGHGVVAEVQVTATSLDLLAPRQDPPDAAGWSTMGNGSGASSLGAVDCPTTHECLAYGTDANGVAVQSEASLSSGRWRWSPASPLAALGSAEAAFVDASCSARQACVALGDTPTGPYVVTDDVLPTGVRETVSAFPRRDWSSNFQATAIACTPLGACTLVGENSRGAVEAQRATELGGHWTWGPLRTDPAAPGTTMHDAIRLEGVGCSGWACEAVGTTASSQVAFTTLSGNEGHWIWSRTSVLKTPAWGDAGLTGVSCPEPTECVAVGNDSNGEAALTAESTDGPFGAWSPLLEVPQSWSFQTDLRSVSCPTTTECVAIGSGDDTSSVVMSARAIDGRWRWTQATDFDNGIYTWVDLTSIDCPTPSECVAAGSLADEELSGDEGALAFGTLVRGSWEWSSIDEVSPDSTGEALLSSVTCVTSRVCLAGGTDATTSVDVVLIRHGSQWSFTPDRPLTHRSDGGNIESISCLQPSTCLELGTTGTSSVDYTTARFTPDGLRWSPPTNLARSLHVTASNVSVSCLTPSVCAVTGATRRGRPVVVVGTLSGEKWQWDVTSLDEYPTKSHVSLPAISCNGVCAAVGTRNQQALIEVIRYFR